MGTDVYMSWDGMTKEEKDRQYTGYAIDAGKFGYLRSAVDMRFERDILHSLFPPRYSLGYAKKYNFATREAQVIHTIKQYLTLKDDYAMNKEDRAMWAKSLVDFFKLGYSLQMKGKNPKVAVL